PSAGAGCTTPAGGSDPTDTGLFIVGYSNTGTSNGPSGYDAKTYTTMVRWGNYDTVNNATRFQAGEVAPSGVLAFMPAVSGPASQVVTPSLFLSETDRTRWWRTPWGTPQYPAIGPDVAGGNLTSGSGASSTLGGHADKIPSRLCFENVGNDSAYSFATPIKAFDGAVCYLPVSGS